MTNAELLGQGWLPIETAPDSGRFEVFNAVTGSYVTEREGDEFPLRNWGGLEGNWFPQPTYWRRAGEDSEKVCNEAPE